MRSRGQNTSCSKVFALLPSIQQKNIKACLFYLGIKKIVNPDQFVFSSVFEQDNLLKLFQPTELYKGIVASAVGEHELVSHLVEVKDSSGFKAVQKPKKDKALAFLLQLFSKIINLFKN